jgi:hypothetical protein
MSPWLESLAVAAVGLLAFILGRSFSRLAARYWLIGYFIPLGLVLLYCLATFLPWLSLDPPVSWMMSGRNRFACFNFAAVMLLDTPLSRLPRRRNRVVICLFMFVLTSVSIIPFLAPAFNRSYLASLKTRVDSDGVCRQSNDYTCAPAAAVTALRKLGLPAEEGELAILAHTSSLTGTEPDVLARELQKHYRAQGLLAEYRAFSNLDDLKKAGLTIAVVKFNTLQDHCVTVLDVQDHQVAVGDPLSGLTTLSVDEFMGKWLLTGVVLRRVSTGAEIK